MLTLSLAGAALLPLLTTAAPARTSTTTTTTSSAAAASSSVTCADIHIFLARGTTQDYPGSMSTLADLVIANKTSLDVDTENIIYPATWLYERSSTKGYEATISQIEAYVGSCPDAELVLLGYSQGAQIIGDAMCGGGGSDLGTATDPIDSSYMDHVSAVVWYGDPRNVINRSYDVGTDTTGNGSFPRTADQLTVCETYADKIHSYCNTNDLFCASGSSAAVHESYPETDDDVAAAWLNSVVG